MSVLVTDAHQRSALAVLRSLRRKGIDVTLASPTRLSPSFYSRYCQHYFTYPSPTEDVERFLESLLQAVKARHHKVLFALSDETVLPISKFRNEFTPYISIPLTEHCVIEKATDKTELIKLAAKLGIPFPKTYFVQGIEELDSIINKISYPVVVRTRRSRIWQDNKIVAGKVLYANSSEELLSAYREIAQIITPPIIQEFIPGKGYGVFALMNNSSPRALFAHKRIREVPYTGGSSSLRESVSVPQMADYAVKLLQALEWHGVCMVEFRLDERDGQPKLIELNPRFWGSLELSIVSGVNFPFLLYQMVVDGDVSPVVDYKTGVKCRWLIPGDISYLTSVMRKETLSFIPKPSKLSATLEFLKFFGKDLHYDYFSFDDPKPAVANIVFWLRSLLGRK